MPTPIQAEAIPAVLAGRDLMGIAQTGTGKTAAFALPILHRLAANRKPLLRKSTRVLVLSPTRELATQIGDSFRTYGRHLGVKVAVVYGGVGHGSQISALERGLDVLVATPGRLIDHMEARAVSFEATEVLVLDEADQMLDLGFVKPIRRIVSKLSFKRQSLFFSATMPKEIGALANELLRDPVKVSVTPAATTVERVSQRVIHVERQKKRALLVELCRDAGLSRALVFTRTKRGADRVARHLQAAGISVAAIHGNKSQSQREAALDAFRRDKIRVLVATDIAARGIDIDSVSHVVNFELPDVPESYVHRIGRTARAGAAGIAISLVDADETAQLRDIERLTRQAIPSVDRRKDTSLQADERAGAGGGKERGARRTTNGRQDSRRSNGGHEPERAREQTRTGSHRPASNGRNGRHADRPDGQRREASKPRSGQRHRGDAPRHAEAKPAPRRQEPRPDAKPQASETKGHGSSLSGVAFLSRSSGRPSLRRAAHKGHATGRLSEPRQ